MSVRRKIRDAADHPDELGEGHIIAEDLPAEQLVVTDKSGAWADIGTCADDLVEIAGDDAFVWVPYHGKGAVSFGNQFPSLALGGSWEMEVLDVVVGELRRPAAGVAVLNQVAPDGGRGRFGTL
jgi:hypothetical protein